MEDMPSTTEEVAAPQPDLLAELRAIKEQNAALLEATKVAQGQARRAEQQANLALQASQVVNASLPRAAEPDDPVVELAKGLNDANPAERLLKQALITQQQNIKRLEQEVGQQRSYRVRDEITAKEQQDRAYVEDQLIEYASDLGVDLRTVSDAIQQLPTSDMWREGKKILRAARTTAPAPEQATSREVYTETRTATGARPSTKAEVEQSYADGTMSTEAYSAWLRTH